MNYIATLSPKQKSNADTLVKAFAKWKITNDFTKSAILSVVSKESAFNYAFEKGYGGTDNSRIRKIFGSRVSHLNDAQLTVLKKDEVAFFNLVYGKMYGNGTNDGYKFRGGGPNQLTFRGNYEKIGSIIGVDLVNHPELVNDPAVAADIACSYFVRAFANFKTSHQVHYNSKNINDFKTLNDAVLAIYHCNAGLGKPLYRMENLNESTGGLKKTVERAPSFYNYITGEKVAQMPFTSKQDGDKFRAWVNDNHPDYARSINLDRSGSHTNAYILKAWEKFGGEYQ
jgi:predicted chitinase